jgi:acyl transferase domain-containing protein
LNKLVGERLQGLDVWFQLPTHANKLSPGVARSGVSSFGYSGTIAHAVIQQVDARVDTTIITRRFAAELGQSTPLRKVLDKGQPFPWGVPSHPFAKRCLPKSSEDVVFRSPAAGALHALVADHVVQGRVVFPGAGYLEMVRAAAESEAQLQGVVFLQPLAVEGAGLHIECAVGNGRFEVCSGLANAPAKAAVNCSGTLGSVGGQWRHVECTKALASVCPLASDVGAIYDECNARGLQYGPGYRTLVRAWGGEKDARAQLRARRSQEGTVVHPSDLDDAICTEWAMLPTSAVKTRLPFSVDDARLQKTVGELWAVRRFAQLLDESLNVRLPL